MTALPSIVDGYSSQTNANRADQVYGETETMRLISGQREGYLAFAIPTSLEPGDTITATVVVPPVKAYTGSGTFKLRATDRWTTSGRNALTWNNPPAVLAGSADRTGTYSAAGWSFTVSADVQAAVQAGQRAVRFRLRTTDTAVVDVSGIPGAYLVISYARPDGAPTDLSPGDGQVVSVGLPVLVFAAPDVQAIQAQLAAPGAAFNATTGFTGPLLDTGTLTQTVPQLDLATTAYGGIADGGSVQWTARYKNSDGTWSPYAAPATISRANLAPPAITTPTGLVYDKTPPLTATMAGLVSAQWLVYDLGVSAKVPVWDSGIYPATSPTSRTPNKDVYTDPKTNYRTEFRGFDGVANRVRNAAAGGNIYASVTVDSVVSTDGTLAGVSTVTATQVGEGPAVDVHVTRAAGAPDAFRYYRDGVQITGDLVPTDLMAAGGWTYRDDTTPPNGDHDHALMPVTNGKAADPTKAGQSATLATVVDMIYLGDPATGDWVPIGGSGITYTRPEDSTEHIVNRSGLKSQETGQRYPTGTLATIRRVRGKQLPMGAVDGTIISSSAGDAATLIPLFLTWQDRAESNPGYVYRLAWKDQNLAVCIGGVECSHTTESDPVLDPIASVSFAYWTA